MLQATLPRPSRRTITVPSAHFDMTIFGSSRIFTYPVPLALRKGILDGEIKVGDTIKAIVDDDYSFNCKLISNPNDRWIADWERI